MYPEIEPAIHVPFLMYHSCNCINLHLNTVDLQQTGNFCTRKKTRWILYDNIISNHFPLWINKTILIKYFWFWLLLLHRRALSKRHSGSHYIQSVQFRCSALLPYSASLFVRLSLASGCCVNNTISTTNPPIFISLPCDLRVTETTTMNEWAVTQLQPLIQRYITFTFQERSCITYQSMAHEHVRSTDPHYSDEKALSSSSIAPFNIWRPLKMLCITFQLFNYWTVGILSLAALDIVQGFQAPMV